jgi:ferritin-like protein
MSSESLHVPRESLSEEARLLHYAITSLKEELDAVDWYRQRADDTPDDQLKQILLHNMREEMEHACMLLEWMRRRNRDFEGHLKTYLFTEGPLEDVEKAAEHGGVEAAAPPADRRPDGFTVGSLIGE